MSPIRMFKVRFLFSRVLGENDRSSLNGKYDFVIWATIYRVIQYIGYSCICLMLFSLCSQTLGSAAQVVYSMQRPDSINAFDCDAQHIQELASLKAHLATGVAFESLLFKSGEKLFKVACLTGLDISSIFWCFLHIRFLWSPNLSVRLDIWWSLLSMQVSYRYMYWGYWSSVLAITYGWLVLRLWSECGLSKVWQPAQLCPVAWISCCCTSKDYAFTRNTVLTASESRHVQPFAWWLGKLDLEGTAIGRHHCRIHLPKHVFKYRYQNML